MAVDCDHDKRALHPHARRWHRWGLLTDHKMKSRGATDPCTLSPCWPARGKELISLGRVYTRHREPSASGHRWHLGGARLFGWRSAAAVPIYQCRPPLHTSVLAAAAAATHTPNKYPRGKLHHKHKRPIQNHQAWGKVTLWKGAKNSTDRGAYSWGNEANTELLWDKVQRKSSSRRMNLGGSCCLVTKPCPTLCASMEGSPPDSSVHWTSQARITGVGCHFLLQGVFLTQRSDLRLLHCRQILYRWATREAPGEEVEGCKKS